MLSEAIITAHGLGKCYHVYASPADRLKQMLHRRLARATGGTPKQRYREFWALRGVDFDIHRGETVGILGRNGSGKTTLLQLLCGTLPWSEGHCSVRGRIAALLELGAGFKPEFTGRENVLINSAITGIPDAEAIERMDQVVEFAELRDVIDQPVKTYSSGMYVRLAFSAAIHVRPDILVVDEALAVGDARFQAKCFRRINEMKEQGVTILFVSHATEQVAMHCTRALLLDQGRLLEDGPPRAVCNHYLDLLFGRRNPERKDAEALDALAARGAREAETRLAVQEDGATPLAPAVAAFVRGDDTAGFAARTGYHDQEYRWGNGSAEITGYLLVAGDRIDPAQLYADEEVELYVRVRFRDAVETPVFGFNIKTLEGLMLTGCNSRDAGDGWGARYRPVAAGETVVCRFRFKPSFATGHYLLSLGVAEDHSGDLVPLDRRYDSVLLKIENRDAYFGLVGLGARCERIRAADGKAN